ncbi:MAG: hypothetical protein QM610_01295 [Chitinophagaceae bacterium]
MMQIYKKYIYLTIPKFYELRADTVECKTFVQSGLENYRKIMLEIFEHQRGLLYKMRKENSFSDEAVRKTEMELDIEEAKMEK